MLNVLIVDDSSAVRVFLKEIVKTKLGHNVTEAENGLVALKIIKEKLPDVILLDLMMPVLDGVKFLELVRGDDNFSKLPIVVLSANNDRATIQKLSNLGISFFLLKPLVFQDAIDKINKYFTDIENSLNNT